MQSCCAAAALSVICCLFPAALSTGSSVGVQHHLTSTLTTLVQTSDHCNLSQQRPISTASLWSLWRHLWARQQDDDPPFTLHLILSVVTAALRQRPGVTGPGLGFNCGSVYYEQNLTPKTQHLITLTPAHPRLLAFTGILQLWLLQEVWGSPLVVAFPHAAKVTRHVAAFVG